MVSKSNAHHIDKSKPVLVVGGAGYIGSHVVEQLLKKGYRVRIFDKFMFGESIVSDLLSHKRVEYIKGDIGDLHKLTTAIIGSSAVVHLAGLVGDLACLVDPDLTLHMNLVSTKIVKDVSKIFHIPRFIFASSCSVYGATAKKVGEKDTLNPVSLYAQTKIDSEKEILSDTQKDFIPTVLRFATVFGHSRRPRFDLVANLFVAQAYTNGTITVSGPNQWRPFVHVSDVARAVVAVLEAPAKKVNREIFNVGDESQNMTIGELGLLAGEIVKKDKQGKKVTVKIEENIHDKRNYMVSFKKIKKELGFSSSVPIKQGLQEIYSHFKKGSYGNSYKAPLYTNLEMTKMIHMEYQNFKKTLKKGKKKIS